MGFTQCRGEVVVGLEEMSRMVSMLSMLSRVNGLRFVNRNVVGHGVFLTHGYLPLPPAYNFNFTPLYPLPYLAGFDPGIFIVLEYSISSIFSIRALNIRASP